VAAGKKWNPAHSRVGEGKLTTQDRTGKKTIREYFGGHNLHAASGERMPTVRGKKYAGSGTKTDGRD